MMKYFGKTDIGAKRRNNQDSYAVISRGNFLCAIVCDGMGGAKGGNVASGLAVKTFASVIKKSAESGILDSMSKDEVKELLSGALRTANDEVYFKSISDEDLDGMGTTLVAVLVCTAGCFAINVGDSRVYADDGNVFRQVTKDHSFVQFLIDKGEITAEQAALHPNKNIILRAVGVNDSVEGDIFEINGCRRVLLCTDGLTNHVSESEIADTIRGTPRGNGKMSSLKSRIQLLIDRANANGGSDNITAVLLENE